MIKLFELQQEVDNVGNHQSRIEEFESFDQYLSSVEQSLPRQYVMLSHEFINHENKTITFVFKNVTLNMDFVHYAEVID